ncbi:MAG TPA: hypothetical protein EYQ21_04910 [Flavobacteriales bacterium]|nr:hypothetical protein [Flavobacteriales bacterium]
MENQTLERRTDKMRHLALINLILGLPGISPLGFKEENDLINEAYKKERDKMPTANRMDGKLIFDLPDSFSQKDAEKLADSVCDKMLESDFKNKTKKKSVKKFSRKSHRQNKVSKLK